MPFCLLALILEEICQCGQKVRIFTVIYAEGDAKKLHLLSAYAVMEVLASFVLLYSRPHGLIRLIYFTLYL
jgi:hypothetical protein